MAFGGAEGLGRQGVEGSLLLTLLLTPVSKPVK